MSRAPSEKIKVVHYVSKWLPQTMAWLYDEVRFLSEHQVENHIVCDETWGLDQFPARDIHSLDALPSWRQYLMKLKRKLRLTQPEALHLPLLEKVFHTVKPDILHSHFGHMGWTNARLAREQGIKHVVSFYGADVNYIPYKDHRWVARYREMGRYVDQVLCEGPFMAGSIAHLGIPREQIRVHRLGVDLSRLRFEPRQYRKGTTLRFLMVSSFREKKGIPYALEALARFRNISNQFEVTLIGDAYLEHEKAEKERIIQKIAETGLSAKVRLMGSQPHETILQEAYRHHIFLAPSLTASDGDCEGGAPVVIIEMAATGMPVVSTTHCDIPFVLSQQNSPYLVAERDSEGLCDAIVRLISSGWDALLAANRRFIEQELDARKQGERLQNIYSELCN